MAPLRDYTMQLFLPFLAPLLLGCVHAQTTRLPPITQPDKIGYTADGSTWGTANCPASSTWYRTSTWGRCCPVSVTTPCAIWTGCASTSLIFLSGGRQNGTCSGGDPVCRTALIAQDENDRTPLVYVGCGEKNWTAFRTAPLAVVESLTIPGVSSTRSASASTSSLFTASSTATTNTASNTASQTGGASQTAPPPPISSDGGSSSNAWIAGVVIGPIAAIVIAGLLLYIWRLKRTKNDDPSAQPMMGHQPHAPSPHIQQAYYLPDGQYGQYPPQQQYNAPANPYNAPTEYYGQQVNKPYHDQYAHAATGPVELSATNQELVEAPANPAEPGKIQQR